MKVKRLISHTILKRKYLPGNMKMCFLGTTGGVISIDSDHLRHYIILYHTIFCNASIRFRISEIFLFLFNDINNSIDLLLLLLL